MKPIGILIAIRKETDFRAKFREAKEMGISSCQLSIWDGSLFTPDTAEKIRTAAQAEDFTISLLWAGWSGPCEWNFTAGPDTLGLVPESWRGIRLAELKRAADFAALLGVTDIATHVGFMPENPSDMRYAGVIAALRDLCLYMKAKGQNFLFETGQETPVTLLRAIEDIGTGNAYINLDTGNLILYGKGNPADAVRVFGRYVRNTHIKDGFYPQNGRELGREVKAGTGLACIPEVIALLQEVGYTGPYTIEREIDGEEQKRDIAETVAYLNTLLA